VNITTKFDPGQRVYLKTAQYSQLMRVECENCGGLGRVKGPCGPEDCEQCYGTGYDETSPSEVHEFVVDEITPVVRHMGIAKPRILIEYTLIKVPNGSRLMASEDKVFATREEAEREGAVV